MTWTSPILPTLRKMLPDGGDRIKDTYFDATYNWCLCGVKLAQLKPDKAKRDQALDRTAAEIVSFERNWDDFGGESWKKRFTELIDSDPVLKERYQARKAKAKN